MTFYISKIQFFHLLFRINLSLDLFTKEDYEECKDGTLNDNYMLILVCFVGIETELNRKTPFFIN